MAKPIGLTREREDRTTWPEAPLPPEPSLPVKPHLRLVDDLPPPPEPAPAAPQLPRRRGFRAWLDRGYVGPASAEMGRQTGARC
ncbi:MAG: hypothetical protein ACRDJU_02805 [Actinomycetota bacterium]